MPIVVDKVPNLSFKIIARISKPFQEKVKFKTIVIFDRDILNWRICTLNFLKLLQYTQNALCDEFVKILNKPKEIESLGLSCFQIVSVIL